MTYDPEVEAHINANWGVASQLLDFLSARRVLTYAHHREDVDLCVRSALEIRSTMTTLITASTDGPLKRSLREIQRACTGFLDAAGPHGKHFEESTSLFQINLVALQLAVARQVEEILRVFDLPLTSEIHQLLAIIEEQRRPS
ncbi:hypothetical protein [Microbacterium sp.]|uniref:hypothetical protein n=1 Tax=Microbacterium sp. TaxID=51671 RepID=UPI0035AEC8D3